jgi:hypothetical protein
MADDETVFAEQTVPDIRRQIRRKHNPEEKYRESAISASS